MSEPLSAIALGANLGDPVLSIKRAIQEIDALPSTHVKAHSSFYRSRAVGPAQANYTNAVVLIQTGLEALQLLVSLQSIEDHLGRRRSTVRWAPRPIDLDIITYGSLLINKPELIVPHPEAWHRCFVLAPLSEIDPQFVLPGHGMVGELLERCDTGAATPIDFDES